MRRRISIESSFLPEPGVGGLPLAAIDISLGDGVEAGGMEGVAAGEPAQTEPNATRDAMRLNGFHHVDGAGGMKTAGGGQQRGEEPLVEAEEGDDGVYG
jgi:hypothetical protein